MTIYAANKLRSRTRNNQPTKTDQSQSKDTDINVIVGKFVTTRRVPGSDVEPMSGDFSEVPTDLREMIETARDLKRRQSELPKELRSLTTEQLLRLTPAELTARMTPPKPEAKNGDTTPEGKQGGT